MFEGYEPAPHLIDVAMSDDPIHVYMLGIGIHFSDLTDEEKEVIYQSQCYSVWKYEKEISWLRKELAKEIARREATEKPHRILVSVRKNNRR